MTEERSRMMRVHFSRNRLLKMPKLAAGWKGIAFIREVTNRLLSPVLQEQKDFLVKVGVSLGNFIVKVLQQILP